MFHSKENCSPDFSWAAKDRSCPARLSPEDTEKLMGGCCASLYHAANTTSPDLSECPPEKLLQFSVGSFHFRWSHFGSHLEVHNPDYGSAMVADSEGQAALILSRVVQTLPRSATTRRETPESYSRLPKAVAAALQLRALTSFYERRQTAALEEARKAAHQSAELLHILWGDAQLMIPGIPEQFWNWPAQSEKRKTLGESLGITPPEFFRSPGEPVASLAVARQFSSVLQQEEGNPATRAAKALLARLQSPALPSGSTSVGEPASADPLGSWRHGLALAETLSQFAVWQTFVQIMVSLTFSGFSLTYATAQETASQRILPNPVEVAEGWTWPLETEGRLHFGYFWVKDMPTGCLPLCNLWTVWSLCEANRWFAEKILKALVQMRFFVEQARAARIAELQKT